jgi:hypothetical protein
VTTQNLPPISIPQLTFQLSQVGFTRSSASRNGDCYPLSAMAGFEITAAAARNPTTASTARVRQVREGAIDKLTGAAAIDGIPAAVFRASEQLPDDAAAAATAMAPWRQTGFWFANDGHKSATFQLGVALELGRPVAVIEKKDRAYLDPVRIYGARSADGTLIHSVAKPGSPETIPTFKLMPIATLIENLRANPVAFSVVEYNGVSHYNPWLLKPSLRKSANAAASAAADTASRPDPEEPEVAAAASATSDGIQGVMGDMDDVKDGEEAAVEEEEGEWVPIEGAPFVAHLVKGGPRTTAPTRNYNVSIPFSDATPIYPGGKVKFPIVPGAPADGVVCAVPALPPVGSKNLTFTLKLDRAGATADTVTINSALYWKKTFAAGAEGEADAGDEVEAAPEQLALGDRFVVLDDPRMPFVVATVVEVGNSADDPRFDFSASGPRMLCGVRLVFYKSDAELQAAAPGLQKRTLDGISHFVGGCPDHRAARAANAKAIPVPDPLVLGARFVVKDDPRKPTRSPSQLLWQ